MWLPCAADGRVAQCIDLGNTLVWTYGFRGTSDNSFILILQDVGLWIVKFTEIILIITIIKIRGQFPPLYIFHLLTTWCRVLLEKLSGLQLVKKFPAFHGIRRFITALTSVRQLSLSWASPIQSIYPHPTSWRSILILSTHLRLGLPLVSFPPVFPPRHLPLVHISVAWLTTCTYLRLYVVAV